LDTWYNNIRHVYKSGLTKLEKNRTVSTVLQCDFITIFLSVYRKDVVSRGTPM